MMHLTGGGDSYGVELTHTALQQDKRKNIHDQLLAKIERKRLALQKCIDARDAENNRLKRLIEELHSKGTALNEKKIVSMTSMKKRHDDSEAKMKYITERLKLVSQIKLQDEEIDILTNELARLKRKTCPIFSDATASKRGNNPDERD
jgi:hypothetical protein